MKKARIIRFNKKTGENLLVCTLAVSQALMTAFYYNMAETNSDVRYQVETSLK